MQYGNLKTYPVHISYLRKMNSFRLLFLLLVLPLVVEAQKEDYNWVFGAINIVDYDNPDSEWGEGAIPTILTFNTDPPSFFQSREITLDMNYTNCTYSNADGQLLLYSNGMSIHGFDHEPIINGDTISYGPVWNTFVSTTDIGTNEPRGFRLVDGAVFFKQPSSDDIYILYTNFERAVVNNDGIKELRYGSISIDEDGVADIYEKDQVFADSVKSSGLIKCAQHANGRDWWLVQYFDNRMLIYLVDPTGISLSHTQEISFTLQTNKSGRTAFSPQGDQLATYNFSIDDLGSEFVIMDFDRCTGLVSNERIKYRHDNGYAFFSNGVEYSPSGQYLYLTTLDTVYQYDTWQDDIFATEQVVMVWDSTYSIPPNSPDGIIGSRPNHFNQLQRGPDNKIYIAGGAQGYTMHIIHNPDEPGLDCRPENIAIILNTFYLCTMPTFNTLRLGPLDGSPCDTLGLDNHPVSRFRYEQDTLDYLSIDFVDLSYYEPTSWEWDFGDGSSSTLRYPFHAYAEDGAYRVCQTVSNQYSTDTSCDTLYLGVSSLSETEHERHITVFPNPVEDVTRVAFHDYLPQDASIRLYDQSGILKREMTLTGTTTLIDLSGLSSGIYLYEIFDMGERIASGKVVKADHGF